MTTQNTAPKSKRVWLTLTVALASIVGGTFLGLALAADNTTSTDATRATLVRPNRPNVALELNERPAPLIDHRNDTLVRAKIAPKPPSHSAVNQVVPVQPSLAQAPGRSTTPSDVAAQPGAKSVSQAKNTDSVAQLSIVEAQLARSVVDRQPAGITSDFSTHDDKVWAWVKVNNAGPKDHITMVWYAEDKESFRYDVKIGTSPRWRTWTRKTIGPKDAGRAGVQTWRVDILDSAGTLLRSLPFETRAPAAGDVAGRAQ